MQRADTLIIMGILKAAYPYFYKDMKANDANRTVDLWTEMFSGDDVNIVKAAVKELIETHTDYPPNIAHVKAKIKAITDTLSDTPSKEEMFNLLRQAAGNGYYEAKEEFDKLPAPIKKWLGSPSKLKELSQLDEDIFNTVTKGQFLKQIDIEIEREHYRSTLPLAVKQLIKSINKIDLLEANNG